jgi:hypothetical protein
VRQTLTNTAKIQRAVAALVTHGTITKAAKAIKTSPRNFSRYTREPEFERLYREAKRELVHQATSRLTANAVQAAVILRKIFDDKKVTAGARVGAATATLRLTLESYELTELERRIADLEKKRETF